MFEFELRMTKRKSGDEKPVTVRGADFTEALTIARGAMPSTYIDGEVFLTSMRQLSVNELRVVELEERNAFLEASFGEAQAEIESLEGAVGRLTGLLNGQNDQVGVLREAFNRQSGALTAIWQLSDDDMVAAAKDAARHILNGDPTGFVTAPDTQEV